MSEQPTSWVVKRNCSASPAQLAAVFASMVGLSFLVGVAFATQGHWLILPFVGIEMLAVAAAFICYGRRAADYERVTVAAAAVTIERAEGTAVRRWRFPAAWTRIEVQQAGSGWTRRARVHVVAYGERVEIGSLLPDAKRVQLASEVAAALRGAAC